MNNLEQQIEEAAVKKFTYLEHVINSLSKVREIWIDGAKSPEAKAYHTQGMYSEEEVKSIIARLLNAYVFHLAENGASGLMDADKFESKEWFEQNRKK